MKCFHIFDVTTVIITNVMIPQKNAVGALSLCSFSLQCKYAKMGSGFHSNGKYFDIGNF